MQPRVFVSHAHADEELYSAFIAELDKERISRFNVKELATGGLLAAQLQEAISQCHVCIFVATAQSVDSKWCLAELGAFWGAGKRVIIFRADDSLKDADYPPQFQGYLRTDHAGTVIKEIEALETQLASPEAQRKRLDAWSVLDELPDAVFIKDQQGKYIYFNHSFQRMFGIRNMMGQTDIDTFTGDPQAFHFVATDNQAFTQQSSLRFCEFVMDHRGVGQPTPYKTVKLKLQGQPYLLGICTDLRAMKDVLFDAFCKLVDEHNSREFPLANEVFEGGIDHTRRRWPPSPDRDCG